MPPAHDFPPFVRTLPQAALPITGVEGYLLESPHGQVVFFTAETEVDMPEHTHGEQWGIIVDGRLDLTLGGVTHTYGRGDSYHVPAGTPHRAHIFAGFRAVDYFADRDRYRPRC